MGQQNKRKYMVYFIKMKNIVIIKFKITFIYHILII